MAEQLELDCYHKAEPGEPKFTLIGRDPLAPGLVRLWAALRDGDVVDAAECFSDLVSNMSEAKYPREHDAEKILNARKIAFELEKWRG